MFVYVCIYAYIYIYRERDIDIYVLVRVCTGTCTCTCTCTRICVKSTYTPWERTARVRPVVLENRMYAFILCYACVVA